MIHKYFDSEYCGDDDDYGDYDYDDYHIIKQTNEELYDDNIKRWKWWFWLSSR